MKPLAMLCTVLALCGLANAAQADDPTNLRVGYQKGSITLVLAKAHGLLETRFSHTRVQWIEFPAGPQMLEALNVGSLDIASTGDIPPIFAQAAGADLLYIGAEPAKPQAEAVLVKDDSPLHSVADLKGKKVAFQKGSTSHNLLLRLLNREGLSFKDIQPVFLTPADARAAYENGSVDAWVIWDPYYSLALNQGHNRALADGTGLELSGPFYTARRQYAEANPAFIQSVLDELTNAEALVRSQRGESLKVLSDAMGLPVAVMGQYVDHRPASPSLPITPQIIHAQQATADLFYANHLLPVAVDVSKVVWVKAP